MNWIRNPTWLSRTTSPIKGQIQNQSRQGMAQQTIFTTANCSGTSDTQQQPLLQPGIRKAPIKHLAICFSQAEHSTAGCSSINVKCWLSKARLLNHNLTIYSLCRQHEYCTSSECGAATPEHACLAATHIS